MSADHEKKLFPIIPVYGFQNGDYLIIEDTNKALWEACPDWQNKEFIKRMSSKLELLKN